jgi:DSF synthase
MSDPRVLTHKEIIVDYEAGSSVIWVSMKSKSRQCFTLTMFLEMLDLFQTLDEYGTPYPGVYGDVKYLVLSSEHPDIFNCGGDLDYFSEMVATQDWDRLMEYGIGCIDLVYWGLSGGKREITTIAYVTGSALGGGFEAALSCNYIFAEEQAVFAFPEALFGFFPGMGGYVLLERFTGPNEADRAFATGKRYSAKELNKLGAIYTLTEKGKGKQAIDDFIHARMSNENTHWALQKIKQRMQNISYDTLKHSIDLWVETAKKLTKRDLRMMKILTKRQKRKVAATV